MSGVNTCKVEIANGSEIYLVSNKPSIASVDPGPYSGSFDLIVTGGSTADIAEVTARAGSISGPVLATLKIRLLPRKEVKVAFIRPDSDESSASAASFRSPTSGTNAVAFLNQVWEKQANIRFTVHPDPTKFWQDVSIGAEHWGRVLNGTAAPDSSENSEVPRVHAAVSQYIPPDTLVFVVAQDVEIGSSDNPLAPEVDVDAFYNQFTRTALIDDLTCDETQAFAHEAGHHIGRDNTGSQDPNFDDNTDLGWDDARTDNLMNRKVCGTLAGSRHHITVRQAKIANDYLH